jgi:hypothetical protein
VEDLTEETFHRLHGIVNEASESWRDGDGNVAMFLRNLMLQANLDCEQWEEHIQPEVV